MRAAANGNLGHEVIFASAGSGKTFALTTRYLRLMASMLPGDPADDARLLRPDRLMALTFSRKAAAEFFDVILKRLTRAASEDVEARRLAAEVMRPALGRAEFCRLLRAMIHQMPRIELGTLDSFFLRLVRAFPFEFGLEGAVKVGNEANAAADRQRVYRNLFRPGNVDPHGFLQAFLLSSIGREERGVTESLDRFVSTCHSHFLDAPDAEKWGRPAANWEDFGTLVRHEHIREARDAACDELDAALAQESCTTAQQDGWRGVAAELRDHIPPSPISGKLERFLKKLSEVWIELCGEEGAEFAVLRTKRWSPLVCRAVHKAVVGLVADELHCRIVQTVGRCQIAEQFEKEYDALVRRHGRLTFADVAYLLAGLTATARAAGNEAWRLKREAIENRLDARFDHWMIDEFQDTSLIQWRIIEPMISELMQSDDGSRTYFHVGDTKQAIYGWRGGESRLARLIEQEFNADGCERVKSRALNDSYRSVPAVIDMVNTVFGASGVISKVFSEAAGRWVWETHRSALPEGIGCAALIRPGGDNQDGHEDEDKAGRRRAEWRAAAGLLERIEPVRRGLTCAVLLRTNTEVREAAEFLRARGIQVVADAETAVALDNPFSAALLALLTVAAHPGDSFARELVRMTPLEEIILEKGWSDTALAWRVIKRVEAEGMEATLREWMDLIDDRLPANDRFSRWRADDLLELARGFDETGSRDIDAFLGSAETYTRREGSDCVTSVQVMTVHQSKGLGFDVVILARPAWKRMGPKAGDLVEGCPPVRSWRDLGDVDWLLVSPPTAICDLVPPLSECRAGILAAEQYEQMCLFYVAMTRAKRGLYVISRELSSRELSMDNGPADPRRWIELAMRTPAPGMADEVPDVESDEFRVGPLFGEWTWFEREDHLPAVEPAVPERPAFDSRAIPVRLPRRRPSSEEAHYLNAEQLFAADSGRARGRGTLVHQLFERVVDPRDCSDLDAWIAEQLPQPEAWQQEAIHEVRACLATSEVASALGFPAPGRELWREQAFEIVLDGAWVTGVIDRVLIDRESAVIIDFKTDRVTDAPGLRVKVDGYRPQLDLYCQVVAKLTALPRSAIGALLVFTRTSQVVRL